MHYRNIFRILGLLIIFFSITMVVPILISLIYIDGSIVSFILTFFITFSIGMCLWLPNKNNIKELNNRVSLLLVILFWVILGSLGALPFLFSRVLHLSVTDAFFESFSGLTTTGATVLIGLDFLPQSILFYRQMLQWFGGIGIIVLVVAILPILDCGGIQLYRTEIPGPVKDNKVKPRISETAKTLLLIYILLTMSCAIFLWISGMSLFDAISHSFSTVSIGGFSTHDDSIGYFHNSQINFVISVFLLLSSLNYSLHFSFLSGGNIFIYWNDLEYRMFIIFQLFLLFIFECILYFYNSTQLSENFIYNSFFQIISISTTAGFSINNILNWPNCLSILLFLFAFIGGCSGSIAGGVKIIRIVLSFKQTSRELNRLIHPHAIYNIKINNEIVPTRVLDSIFAFFFIYFLIFFISIFLLICTGIDFISAFVIVLSTLSNLGMGFGIISDNYLFINTFSKWILIFIMLFGRLELFTLLVVLTPSFWKESF